MAVIKNAELITENLGYYDGTRLWETAILPKIEIESESDRLVIERARRLFQVANKCREIVVRHRNALIGTDPSWYFVNQSGDKEEGGMAGNLAETLRRLQQQWLRMSIGRYENHIDPVAKAIDDCLTTGYGYLRLWSPAKYRNSPNLVQRVGLHSPNPNSVNVINDDDGFVERIEYYFSRGKLNLIEVQELTTDGMTRFHWENEKGQIIPMDDAGTEEIVLNLGGRFSVFEIKHAPLINETLKAAQNALNHALTMVPVNIEFAGFLMQIVANGLPPGEYQEINGKQVFVANQELLFSPGRTNYIAGLPKYDDAGNVEEYTTPQVTTHEPVDISPLIEAFKLFSSVMYESSNQSHILSQDLILSGVSRQQARSDFKSNLLGDQKLIESILSDCWMTSLFMLYDESAISNYDVVVDLLLDLGSPSAEERGDIRENFLAGLLSRKSAISLQAYVDNAEGEAAIIEEETQASIEAGESKERQSIIDLVPRDGNSGDDEDEDENTPDAA